MKRKFAMLLLIGLFAFAGCGAPNTSQVASPVQEEKVSTTSSDYSIDEFGKLLVETNEMFDEKTKYFTEEQLSGDDGYNAYKECSERTGLPINQEIILHGVKKDFAHSYAYCVTSTENGNYYVPCFPAAEENNKYILIPDGDNIMVKGIFSKKNAPYGSLSDAYIVSGIPYNISYQNNIKDIVPTLTTEPSNVVVTGIVREIYDTETFKKSLSYFSLTDAYNPDHLYQSKTVALGSDDESESLPILYFTYNPDVTAELKVGDKITVNGEAYDICDMLTADGSTRTFFGVIDMVRNYYKY